MSKRPRKKIFVQRLEDVDVKYLSLVDRGANRIPFRVLKQENDMSIDLSRIFLRKKESTPTLVGFAVAKNDRTEGVTAAIKGVAGIAIVATEDDNDAAVVLKMEGYGSEDMTLVRISDDVVAAYTGVAKGISTVSDSNSFTKNLSTAGFLPSVHIATDTLVNTLVGIVYSAGDQGETVSKMEAALGDYSEYVNALVRAVPAEVFKQEESVVKGMLLAPTHPPKVDDTPEGNAESAGSQGHDKGEDTDTGSDPKPPEGEAAPAEGANGATGGESGEEGTPPEGDAGSGEGAGVDTTNPNSQDTSMVEDVTKAVEQQLAGFEDKLKGLLSPMAQSLATVQEAVAAVKTAQEEHATKLEVVTASAQKAEEAVKGTVLSGAHDASGEQDPIAKTEKGAGMWDSALNFMDFESK